MTEAEQALRIANRWLDGRMNALVQMVPGDPDCDACVLARQFIRAIESERERCARIADGEAAEYQRRINEYNTRSDRGGDPAIRAHAKRDASENLAALIRGGQWNAWLPPETAPKDGSAFFITTAGPQMDICAWVPERKRFEDYYHKQKILPEWPCMVAWRPLGDPAHVCNTEDESRAANGWPAPSNDDGTNTPPVA